MDAKLKYLFGAVTSGAMAIGGLQCGGSQKRTSPGDASSGAIGNDSGGGGSGAGSGAGCVPGCNRRLSEICCGGQCVRPDNDPLNCGGCGVVCGGVTPFCDGICQAAPCTVEGGSCAAGSSCCGKECCGSTQICCKPNAPVDLGPACQTPTGSPPTCAPGCAPLCVSDRNLKRDVERVDPQAVLDAVSHMPVSMWSYKSDDPSIRHMGPMAQDFSAAFGLGNTDRAYDAIDAHGVAFAAIQALHERVREQDARIERMERENEILRGELLRPAGANRSFRDVSGREP